MIVGIPKETKTQEYRVGLVPAGVRALKESGAKVLVEKGAGVGSGIRDQDYESAGAEILSSASEVWKSAELIVKVKEPLKPEFELMQKGQSLYTYLHLAVAPELTDVLLKKEITAVAYETIQRGDRSLPLLKPMSEVAGKMAVQIGAHYLERENGGKGILLGGVPGVRRGKVTILGGGAAGTNACKMAVGLGADVTVIDVNVDRLEYLDDIFGSQITTLKSHSQNIEESVVQSDLLVGAVLIAGAKAPKLVTKDMVSRMSDGSVVVDIAVDQGGCVETCHPTTHDEPTYLVDGVVHYCVANMPGAVSTTSTYALTNATLSYLKKFAEQGIEKTALEFPDMAFGINTYKGHVTHPAVAEALNLSYRKLSDCMGS